MKSLVFWFMITLLLLIVGVSQWGVGYAAPSSLPNGTPGPTFAPNPATQYDQARLLNNASRPIAAIRLLNEIILDEASDDISRFRAYFLRGQILQSRDEYEQALSDYTEAIALQPDIAAVYAFRATAYFELGEYEAAFSDYSDAIAYDTSAAQYYLARGIVSAQLEDYETAIEDFTEALDYDESLSIAYRERGLAARALDNTEQAVADLEAYLEAVPEAADRAEIEEILDELG